MLSRRALLLASLVLPPLAMLGGCGGGTSLSGPNSNTQAGLGTLIVNVSGTNDNVVVALDGNTLYTRNSSVTFYNVSPGRHTVQARSALDPFRAPKKSVTIIADKTVTISVTVDNDYITPTPFVTPFGN